MDVCGFAGAQRDCLILGRRLRDRWACMAARKARSRNLTTAKKRPPTPTLPRAGPLARRRFARACGPGERIHLGTIS
jgi:hypothetical protein